VHRAGFCARAQLTIMLSASPYNYRLGGISRQPPTPSSVWPTGNCGAICCTIGLPQTDPDLNCRNSANRLTPTIDFIVYFSSGFSAGCQFHDALGVRLGVNFGRSLSIQDGIEHPSCRVRRRFFSSLRREYNAAPRTSYPPLSCKLSAAKNFRDWSRTPLLILEITTSGKPRGSSM
jgi:hypothetical protein